MAARSAERGLDCVESYLHGNVLCPDMLTQLFVHCLGRGGRCREHLRYALLHDRLELLDGAVVCLAASLEPQ